MYQREREELIEIILKKLHSNRIYSDLIPSIDFYWSENEGALEHVFYDPSICIILQGRKSVFFANEQYEYDSNRYLLVPTHIPTKVQIGGASLEAPYVAFQLRFNISEICDVLKVVESTNNSSASAQGGPVVGELNEKLRDSIYRYAKLITESAEAVEFLAPMIKKEVLFNLLSDRGARSFLSQFAIDGSVSNRIAKVIAEIKTHFNGKLNVADLAKRFGMSETTLYTRFKGVTSMTPIQFQKQLRLEESKKMIHALQADISQVAYEVGYESVSQFSREFKRYFGVSPSAFKTKSVQMNKNNAQFVV